jgi:hypothetical protein
VDVLARLGEHPNIVNLLDVACGRDKSSMYLVSLFYFNSRVYGQLGG